jgi:hypothetical protein
MLKYKVVKALISSKVEAKRILFVLASHKSGQGPLSQGWELS